MAQLKKLIDNFDNEDNIICVSESTKRDLLNYREDLIDNNIIVSHLAVANGIKRIRDNDVLNNVKTKFEIGKDNKYLLSVCTLEPRKNLVRIIRNFIELCEEGKIDDTYLVLVGRKGWKYNDLFIERANNSKYLDRIIFTGYVNDEDMSALMSGCLYFIYISLYEGFGLPPLEAMKCGAPVITSNCSSLPEVVGNNALKVDPTNDEEIRSAMYKLYTDENLRNDLSNKSLEQAAKFSWEKATAKIMQFIETVTK
jgi:glycosyltransferase involved in cell wall biosynthesis